MKRNRLIIFLLSLLILATLACTTVPDDEEETATPDDTSSQVPESTQAPEPTSTPDATADFTTLQNEGLGVAVSYPPNWVTNNEEAISSLVMASSQAVLDTGTSQVQEGAAVVIFSGPVDEFPSRDPIEAINIFIEGFDLGSEASITDGPTVTEFNGQEGAMATLNGIGDSDKPFIAIVALIIQGDRAAIVISSTPTDSETEYRGTLEAIIDTVTLSEPVVAAATAEPTPIDTPESEPPTPESELPSSDVATPIEPGLSYNHTLPENGHNDYLFQGVAGSAVLIVVDPEEDLDAVFEIYRAEELGSDTLQDIDARVAGVPEETIFTPPLDGQYIIRVHDFADGTGTYQITMSESDAGTMLDLDDLPRLSLGQSFEGALRGEAVDHVFSGTTGNPTTFVLIPHEETDVTVAVYDQFNNELLRIDDGYSGELEAIVFSPESDDNFVLRVDAFGPKEGGYTLTMLDDSQALFIEGTVAEGEVNNFRLCVPAGQGFYAVGVPEEGFDLTMELHDAAGEGIVDLDNGFAGEPEVLVYTEGAESTEQYVVVLQLAGFVGHYGNYTLTIAPIGEFAIVEDGC